MSRFLTQIVLLSLLGVLTLPSNVNSHDCSNVLYQETSGLLNYLGNLTFTAPSDFSGTWNLVMKTDVPFTFIGGYKMWVNSDEAAGLATFKPRAKAEEDTEISKGQQVSVRFRIQWGRRSPVPQVISLLWNNQQLCE